MLHSPLPLSYLDLHLWISVRLLLPKIKNDTLQLAHAIALCILIQMDHNTENTRSQIVPQNRLFKASFCVSSGCPACLRAAGWLVSGTHLHHKALVMASASLRDEFILQASSFLIELHYRIFATCCENRALSSYLKGGSSKQHFIVLNFLLYNYTVSVEKEAQNCILKHSGASAWAPPYTNDQVPTKVWKLYKQ